MNPQARYIVEVLLGDREAIRAAAIRFPDGTIYEAPFHAECWCIAYSMGKIEEDPSEGEFVNLLDKYRVEEGFTTTFNRFVDRHQAFEISVSSGQRPEEKGTEGTQWLDSHDVADKYRNESMDEYGELAMAIDPRSYAKQTSEQVGKKCSSINYEWSAVPNGWLEPACIKVRFTVTNTLVDGLTSTVNPIVGIVQTVGGQYPSRQAAYVADQRGPGATNHLIGIYRAIKLIGNGSSFWEISRSKHMSLVNQVVLQIQRDAKRLADEMPVIRYDADRKIIAGPIDSIYMNLDDQLYQAT